MHRLALLLTASAAALLAFAAAVVWPGATPGAPPPALAVSGAVGAPPGDGSSPCGAAPAAIAPERAAGEVRQCVGRCVDAATDAPLAGVAAALVGGPAVRTDADGRFALPVPVGATSVTVQLAAPGCVVLERRIDLARESPDLGKVRVARGAEVAGELVDEAGRPCAGVAVQLELLDHAARGDGFDERFCAVARSGMDGSLSFPLPLPAGPVAAAAPGAPPLVGATTFVLAAGANRLRLVCRAVDPRDAIRGAVVDRWGRAVPAALVQAFATAAADGVPVAWSRTDADGAFVLLRPPGSGAVVWPVAQGASAAQRSDMRGPIAWGEGGVSLQLSAGDGVWLQVVDAGSGAPVEGFAVQCVPGAGVRDAADGRLRADGEHPGGWLWLDALPRGPNRVIVWPRDLRFVPNLPLGFDVGPAGGGVVRVPLPAAAACPVRVVTAAGQPVPDADVELLVPAAGAPVRDLEQLFAQGGGRGPVAIRVARARTNRDGVATLRWFADPEPRELRVTGADLAPLLVPDVRVGPEGVAVTVAETGRLRLELAGAAGRRVVLRAVADGRELPPPWANPLQLDGAGRLAVAAPVGDWQVFVAAPVRTDRGPWLVAPAPFATVTIAAGATTRLARELGPLLAAGAWTGSAFVDGEPAGRLALQCGVVDGDGQVRAVHAIDGATDDAGRFTFADLPAGRYRLQVWLAGGGRTLLVAGSDWQLLSPGERRAAPPVALTTASLTVRLRGSDGRPVADGQFVLRGPDALVLLCEPDARGDVCLQRVPCGRYELSFLRAGEAQSLGVCDVGPGLPERTVVLR